MDQSGCYSIRDITSGSPAGEECPRVDSVAWRRSQNGGSRDPEDFMVVVTCSQQLEEFLRREKRSYCLQV